MSANKKRELLINFGKNIKEERLKNGFSQGEFADKVGVHRTYIGMIERGEKNITLMNIKKIADALNIKVNLLFINL